MTARPPVFRPLAIAWAVAAVAVAASPAAAGTHDCVPIGPKSADRLKAAHGAGLLSAAAGKELAAGRSKGDDGPVVVLTVDRHGRVRSFVPAAMPGHPRLCKATYPLAAGTLLNTRTITIQATSNPKVCWTGDNATTQCIEW